MCYCPAYGSYVDIDLRFGECRVQTMFRLLVQREQKPTVPM